MNHVQRGWPHCASLFTLALACTHGAASAQATSNTNSFNPAVSVILSGTYANLSKDPATWRMAGFVPAGDEAGPGSRGFSLSESEVGLSANIDAFMYGALTLAVSPDDKIAAEEAFVQSTALPQGLTLKLGRFYSGLGYLNEQHAHTWDFVDAPLAYQAFVGGQYKQEGAQLRWLAPTEQFIELGLEAGNGRNFPGSERSSNGLGSLGLTMHTGGDVGDSHNWRAGVSWLRTQAKGRAWDDTNLAGNDVSNAFTGTSRLWVLDGVWKWAPHGNAVDTNIKLQGEYFRRVESGQLTYATGDAANEHTDAYRSAQSGWYLQGIYQFTKGWRLGLRHDALQSGTTKLASNAANLDGRSHAPHRDSVMLDWSPSEFQRWRLQVSNDHARADQRDAQVFLQYQMSLGAHGAHSY
jgi:hypothetical protein